MEGCSECKAPNSIVENHNNGTLVCNECGLVVESKVIDQSSEWRNFSAEASGSRGNDQNRVGGPTNPLLEHCGIDTVVTGGSAGNNLSKWNIRNNLSSLDKALT
jgi:transcription initiation factor TFIIB